VAKDEFTPAIVEQGLRTRFVGRNIQYVPRLASTMDVARTAAIAGVANGTVVLAGEQTAGRGRLKREWISPQGCLAFSLILYPEMRCLPGLVMVAALAVAEAVTAITPIVAELKWPNDVLIRGKKVSGILVETGLRTDCQSYAVIGIGLNVNLDSAACLKISPTATSLSREIGRELSRSVVLCVLLARFEHLYEAFLRGEPVFEAWRARLTTLGKEVQVLAGGMFYEGVAEDVASDGALLIRMGGGCLMRMPAGDVTLKVSATGGQSTE